MNSFDGEMHVSRQKESARRAAENYIPSNDQPGKVSRRVHRRALAGLGSRMITLGYRLQGEIDQLSATPALVDSLGLTSNNPCPDN